MIVDKRGTLAEQIKRRVPPVALLPLLATTKRRPPEDAVPAAAPRADLILTNGVGGFTPDGREYVITLASGQHDARTVGQRDSESRSLERSCPTVVPRYTWNENAHEFRLTPWHNDPVTDESGEAFYLRDEETGRFWSPTRRYPSPGEGPT